MYHLIVIYFKVNFQDSHEHSRLQQNQVPMSSSMMFLTMIWGQNDASLRSWLTELYCKSAKLSLNTPESQGTRWIGITIHLADKKETNLYQPITYTRTRSMQLRWYKNRSCKKNSDKQEKKDFIARSKKGSLAFFCFGNTWNTPNNAIINLIRFNESSEKVDRIRI